MVIKLRISWKNCSPSAFYKLKFVYTWCLAVALSHANVATIYNFVLRVGCVSSQKTFRALARPSFSLLNASESILTKGRAVSGVPSLSLASLKNSLISFCVVDQGRPRQRATKWSSSSPPWWCWWVPPLWPPPPPWALPVLLRVSSSPLMMDDTINSAQIKKQSQTGGAREADFFRSSDDRILRSSSCGSRSPAWPTLWSQKEVKTSVGTDATLESSSLNWDSTKSLMPAWCQGENL